MKKCVIRQTKNRIWICESKEFNRIKYEQELKIKRCLLCECSPDFLYWLSDCNSEELFEVLNKELVEDKLTLYSN